MTHDEQNRRVRRTHEDDAADFYSKSAGVPLDEAKELVAWVLQRVGSQPDADAGRNADAETPMNNDNPHEGEI